MKTLSMKPMEFLLLIFDAWGIFLICMIGNYYTFGLQNIFCFLFLIFVPGIITLYALRLKGIPLWGYVSLAIAFSLLELMLVALMGNTLLPLMGVVAPLSRAAIAMEISLLVGGLALFPLLRKETVIIPTMRCNGFRDLALAFAPAFFVVMSVVGAMQLNDGGSGVVTLLMLGAIGIYLAALILYAEDTAEDCMLTGIFFVSLSLLLMTSMRGWYITGHDVQLEYKVFELTKVAGLWSIAAYRDAYNACLSITILPTIFSAALNVYDQYIYKFYFQIFFALCPGIVYLVSRHWTSRRISLLSAIYFIALPTFFSDMPFLVRQEVAFLFFGLMIYVLFEPSFSLGVRRVLFMMLGVGVILSHYSTTYTVLLLLAITMLSRPIIVWMLRYAQRKGFFKGTALDAAPRYITWEMVLVLVLLSFLWTAVITDTGAGVENVIAETSHAVLTGFIEDNRSNDAVSFLSFSAMDQQQALDAYIKNDVTDERAAAPAGYYYDPQSYASYPMLALPEEQVPLTAIGGAAAHLGIGVPSTLSFLGQILSKVLEVLAPIGLLYLLFRKKYLPAIDIEFYLLASFSFVFVVLNAVLPVLSTEYGIFRAMQQSLFVLAPILVAGSALLGAAIAVIVRMAKRYFGTPVAAPGTRSFGMKFASVLAVAFFLYSTSFIPHVFGGTVAALHLDDNGAYYDTLLTQTSELYAAQWLRLLSDNSPAPLEIQAEKYTSEKFSTMVHLDPSDTIFPALVRRDAYVFLDQAAVTKGRAVLEYAGNQITYSYPTAFLDDNKDLVYNNGDVRIYH